MDDLRNRKYEVPMEEIIPLIKESLAAGQSVEFSPKGESMLPMLRQGRDTVTLSPVPGRLKKYDLPLYCRSNGKYVLHRIVGTKDGYTCIGDNQFVKEKGLSHDQMVGVVTAFSRDGKPHSVKEAGYGVYCRVWHYSRFFRRCLRAFRRRIFK